MWVTGNMYGNVTWNAIVDQLAALLGWDIIKGALVMFLTFCVLGMVIRLFFVQLVRR
jgi:hypothetical protein